MIQPGLVSVSFRSLVPSQVIRLAKENGLYAIEWGGDVHVPAGDLDRAGEVKKMCEQASIEIVGYGSYFRCQGEDPGPVVETAIALGTPMIRVWAGTRSSADATTAERKLTVESLRGMCNRAGRARIRIAIEFHPNTLADTADSALNLFEECHSEHLGIHWQPDPAIGFSQRLSSLNDLLPHLTHVHVFNWHQDGNEVVRRPLTDAQEEWSHYLRTIDRSIPALLEFMPSGEPEELAVEAASFHAILSQLAGT